MKKKFIVSATALLMTLSVTFTQDIRPVPAAIVNELHKEFKNVTNVKWKTKDNYYKATITVDETALEVFYSFKGQLIATSRNIELKQLPLSLIKGTKEKAATSQITELFELLTERGTEYFVTFKTGKETKTYKSNGGRWSRHS